MSNRNQKGFTLIEILIVVAILGVIASIAYPSYQESVNKGRRADAKAMLGDVSQRLQRCFTVYSAYNDDNCAVEDQLTDGNTIDSQEGFYTISATNVTATTFTLTATAVGVQANDTKCGNFGLTNTGTRSVTGSSGTDYCW
ncbi:type IV pilin protein [Microbulbifer zhoushanensis]|uniref:type IV pilin protein n=1 Tax=Microbulbifer zhoushanensis TaxID=2904254 RepID=UPI0034E1A4B0